MTTRYAVGHTAFHHLGAVPGDCVRGGSPYKPTPSSPYYLFGAQRRYPYAWSGAAGGVPQSRVAAESRGLGIFDLAESGLTPNPKDFIPFPGFNKTMVHHGYVPSGDWPLARYAGREPDDPRGDGRGALGLSDNEKLLGKVLALGVLGYVLYKKLGKAGPRGSRRLARSTRQYYAAAKRNPENPVHTRYEVHASASHKRRRGRRRRLEYAGSFVRKREASDYARYLREGGHKAQVRRK